MEPFVHERVNSLTPVVDEALTCPICLELLRQPTLLAETGATYCYPCISRHLATGRKTCPVTNQKLNTAATMTNYSLTSIVDKRRQQLGLPTEPEKVCAVGLPSVRLTFK